MTQLPAGTNEADEELRKALRHALKAAGIRQAHAAQALGITPKHISQMLTGKCGLSLHWAQQIAAITGHRIDLVPADREQTSGQKLLAEAALNTELAELRVDNQALRTQAKKAVRAFSRIRVALDQAQEATR